MSGNASEESTHVITLFNPNDERYNLEKHFGLTLKDSNGVPYYPNLRSVHLVESRLVECPRHFHLLMEGNIKTFKSLSKNE